MRHFWKRWIAGLLTAVMLVTMLPATAYAALWENSSRYNREILAALEALCGSEDEARYYYDLLEEYGLLEEDGDLFTNWSGVITIQEDSTPLTIAQVRAMSEGNVTVNGRACSVAALNAALDGLEALGLLVDNAPVAYWQLQVDGQDVAPAELETTLENWQAPAEEPEQPQEPETPDETTETTEQSDGILASIAGFFGVGTDDQATAAPVVTVLGQTVDSGEVLEAVAFLDQYGLLTATGCAADWALALPGGDREITVEELLDMVESGELADDAVVNVDGIPVTVADLKVMLEIEEYIAYLRETYFDGHQWTQEQLDNLADLVDQINNEGIVFQGVEDTEKLERMGQVLDDEWPSGIRQDVVMTVETPENPVLVSAAEDFDSNHHIQYTVTLKLNKPQLTAVTLDYTFYGLLYASEGDTSSGTGGLTAIPATGQVEFAVGETEKQVTMPVVLYPGEVDSNASFGFTLSNLTNAVFEDGSTRYEKAVHIEIDYTDYEEWYQYYGPGAPSVWDTSVSMLDPPWVDANVPAAHIYVYPGEYAVGQSIPIRIYTYKTIELVIKRGEEYSPPTITCWTTGNEENKQTLTPLQGSSGLDAYGSTLIYLYVVQPGDSGVLQIGESNIETPILSRHYPYENDLSDDDVFNSLLVAKDGTNNVAEQGLLYVKTTLPENRNEIAAKAKIVDRPRQDIFEDFSFQLTEGREGLTNPQLTVSLTFTSNKAILEPHEEWLLSNAITQEGQGFVTVSEVLGFSLDGGETLYSFPIPTKADGDPIEDFTGVTLTTTIDLPLLNMPPENWYENPGYPAAEDVLRVAELYVEGEPVYGCADADLQRGIRFIDGGVDALDFEADFEFVHTYTGQAWTEEDYQNIEFTSVGAAIFEEMPWFTLSLPTLTVQDTDLKFNISTENAVDTDKVPLSFGDTSSLTGFQLDGEGGYVSSQDETRPSCGYVPLDLNADFGILSQMPTTARVDETGDITYLAPGPVAFEVHATNGMIDDLFKTRANWSSGTGEGVAPSFFDLIPLPDFPAPTQEEWAQTWAAIGDGEAMPAAPTSWEEFAPILSELTYSEVTLENYGDLNDALGLNGSFYISMGTDPFLSLPNPAMQATSGQDVTVYWSSNLCELNKGDTTFTVTVTKGDDTVYTATATGTKDAPASSVTIPANTLRYDYGAGASNQYTVTVSAEYLGEEYTAEGTIDLAAKPAKVTLGTLSSYYITDATSSVTIDWDLTDFGDITGGQGANQQFELLITKGSQEVAKIESPGTAYGDGNANYKGSYTLDVSDVQIKDDDPTSFRDVYTVTVKAMAGNNGTWSYDSFLLYVYDQNALDILIGGESVEGYKLSNREQISNMSQEQILALNRDIQLKEVISTNYGERAWNALADQIIWKSGDSSVASINYPQGSYYDNIENFSYVSYRPTTDFGILGRDNGQTTFTATHKVTGISDSVPITVETLENKLYLFQFYPQAVTTIVYTNGNGVQTTMTSDANGAAAIYEESGITGIIYCSSKDASGKEYRGTLYADTLKSGEGDWTKLEQYPCNNLNLRRTAYAYLYLKNPDGTPYTGTVSFRGGIYVNDKYVEEGDSGLFFLNGSETPVYGNQGVTVNLSTNGKLTVEMDQTLWNNRIKNGDQVSYIFELISTKGGAEDTSYYPIFTVIDASANQNAFVSSGEAIVNFQENPAKDDAKHPFVATQIATLGSGVSNVMDYTGYVGINEDLQEGVLSTAVMWWNDTETVEHSLQLETLDGRKIADGTGEYTIETTTYPFTSHPVTNYTVRLNADTVGRLLNTGEATGVVLKYYTNGEMVRYEEMPYRLGNLRGAGKAEDSRSLLDEIQGMGNSMDTNGEAKDIEFTTDQYISMVLEFMADEDYTTGDPGAFRMQLAPTSDPTKFMGFISVSLGTLNDDEQVTGVYGNAETGAADYDYTPGFRELMALAGEKTFYQWSDEVKNEFMSSQTKSGVKNIEWGVSGYMEALIYYDFDDYAWKARILSGGFSAGGGMSRSFFMNTLVGIIPITATLTVGGTAEVSMDALAVSYYNETQDVYGMGNDFLTELRLYLYLRFFAGIGFDYSVVAAKIGVFGQINLDMRFDWLNRPYMDSDDKIMNVADKSTNEGKYNLNGQSFNIKGTAGLEVLLKLLFISYEKILCSWSWDLLDEQTGEWKTIQTNWNLNSAANRAAVSGMMRNGSLEVYSAGGQQMLALNLAPTLEDRSYLENGGRVWGQGFSLFSLDPDGEQGLKNLESNTYPYANPVVTDDGQLVVYLHDNSSVNVEDTVVKYATKSGTSYSQGGAIPAPSNSSDEGNGYGDSQLSIGGTGTMAVAAWTRQMTSIEKVPLWVDEQGRPVYGQIGDQLIYSPTLTADEQMMMLNGTEIYASVYANGQWTTTRLTENSTSDMAPVVASNGKTAIVAWRSVAASNLEESGGTIFDQRDSILYKVYDGTNWGETKTLYNGTSGAVKGIVADMMADGTAAVAYALDTDLNDNTTTDREIAYAVIDKDSGEVTRNVQATKDSYLDENPQLTSVKFGNEERFVLGWYTEQAVASDDAAVLDGGEDETSAETVSDIRLMEFGTDGTTSQLLPDSMDQISSDYDVNITSNFRFTKNSETIDDLSILWVERAEEITAEDENTATLVERDVLKGVKFYTHGADHQQISFTAAVDVAEMGDGTLIDHFDAYVSNAETNEIKAVILGTTYDANNPVTKVAETTGGETVSVQIPSKESAMYTATETYTDKIEVPAFLLDYDTVRLGAKTQLQFTVENKGIHAISKIEIQVGDTVTPHELATPLLPGDSIQLYADYEVPQDKVVDPTYKVTATFDENTGATGSAETGGSAGYLFGLFGAEDGLNVVSGTVYLDLPDVEIVQAKVMSEENGQRTIQIGLSNHSDAALANSGRSVRLSFFTDAACQTPIDEELLKSITIDQDNDLAELDEGGYSTQITFDVGEFLKKQNEDGTVQEIPSGGVILYIKAEVLDKEKNSQGEPVVQGEPTAQDNYASVTCDNLKERTGKDVIVKSDISVEDGAATVTVDLQNTRLTETATGNLLVTMLDANGTVVGYQQSYDPDADDKGLITLGGEGKATTQTFTFDNMAQYPGATFQVQYSDLRIEEESGEANTELGSLFCQGLLSNIDDVKWTQDANGNYEATVINHGVSSTQVTAMAKSPDAKVSFSGASGKDNTAFDTVSLDANGAGTITITVTNGDKSSTYTLNIQNGDTPPETVKVTGVKLNESNLTLTEGGTKQLTATVEPEDATNKSVSWSSSDSTIVTVENGKITAVGVGTATITVTTQDGNYKATCEVKVNSGGTTTVPVESVSLSKNSLSLTAGSTGQLTATITPSNATDKSVTWSSSNTSVATVDGSGKVTAHKAGTTTITVTTVDGNHKATCTVTVEAGSTPTVPVNSVSLNKTNLTLTVNGTEKLTATITPSNATNKGLTWSSSNTSVATVDSSGTVTAHKAGTATITVTTADGGKTATCTVTVTADSGNSGSGSGGGSSSYAVNIDAGTDHGTVTVRPTRAESGQTVTITTKPDEGYQVGKVTVTRANGTTVAVTDKGDGVYTFTMPNSRVTVDVTFVPVDTACDGGADCPSRAFTDLSTTAWYHEAVDYVLRNGIMGGYGGGLFGPNDSLSRAQLCQILYNREGKPTVTGSSPFTDVADTAWYADAVIWANANGIVGGYGGGLFGPNDPITREQLAAILWRYAGSPASDHTLTGYTDADQISSWAMDAMLWANENNILNGDGSGHLIPKGRATRAQVAQMIRNFIKNLEEHI